MAACGTCPSSSPLFLSWCSPSSSPSSVCSFAPLRPLRIRCGRRTGKQRYPSEKKKLRKEARSLVGIEIKDKGEGFWRISKLSVPVEEDPGKDSLDVCDGLLKSIAKVLEFPVASLLPREAFSIVRKSFDARKLLKEPKFMYTVDMDAEKLLKLEPRTWDFISHLEPKLGLVEYMPKDKYSREMMCLVQDCKWTDLTKSSEKGGVHKSLNQKNPRVAVVGSGPSGLFASLVLAELGAEVTLIERGKPVEQRGRDIGALVVRRIFQPESNFCFGEGGAGTWSDGKLVTRIGRNGDSVQSVLRTLVHFGAPPNILIDGKPHLGTDRLVPLIRNFRQHLLKLGVNTRFGTRLDDLLVENSRVHGIQVSDGGKRTYDAIVLAVGHSARDVYKMLLHHKVEMIPKDFAVGLRVEHPQKLINAIQYSELADQVCDGRGKIPVADYKLVNYVSNKDNHKSTSMDERRCSCYSFCMCPGGQVVLTSTDPSELCVNGMSFSLRASKWANAALVVTVSSKDFEKFQCYGPLSGVEFQREYERRAAALGGGGFVVPVQTVTDFLDNRLSNLDVPQSSYRLGVKAANLHDLFPAYITQALQQSILAFDKELPGFISRDALLHGVETRTSAPVKILRDNDTYESVTLKGLYPIGEGAGYAGGIVSAAVDGLQAGFAVAKDLGLYNGDLDAVLGKAQKNTGFVKY